MLERRISRRFKGPWGIAVGASLLGLLAGGAIAASVSESTAKTARKARATTVVLYSRDSTQTRVDNPPSGPSAGDVVILTSPLYKRPAGGQPVGRLDLHRVYTAIEGSQTRVLDQINETLIQGQIASGGSTTFGSAQGQPLAGTKASRAVLGGTGRYRLARGELRSRLVQGGVAKLTHRLFLRP